MTAAERIAEYDARQRFRPYLVKRNGEQVWIAAAGTPTLEGIGGMLQTLMDDGEYDSRDVVGVLDTGPWQDGEPGRWLINPHGRERS